MRKESESNIKIIPNYYQNNAGVEILKYFKEAFSYHSILSSRESCIVNLYIFYRAQDFPELLLWIWIATETLGNKLLYLLISWVSNWDIPRSCCWMSSPVISVYCLHDNKEHFHTLYLRPQMNLCNQKAYLAIVLKLL